MNVGAENVGVIVAQDFSSTSQRNLNLPETFVPVPTILKIWQKFYCGLSTPNRHIRGHLANGFLLRLTRRFVRSLKLNKQYSQLFHQQESETASSLSHCLWIFSAKVGRSKHYCNVYAMVPLAVCFKLCGTLYVPTRTTVNVRTNVP